MSLLENKPVKKVRQALVSAGLPDTVVELSETAKTAEQAAASLGVALGSIVKSLVFTVDGRIVMALVAGDHRCLENNLPRALNLEGKVRRPQASEVKGATGFTIGGVAPIGLAHPLPTVIDRSLKRFEVLHAAAGHPHCVFPISFGDLARLTGAIVSWNIAEPSDGGVVATKLKRSKTFSNATGES